jgi:hypothetical protein
LKRSLLTIPIILFIFLNACGSPTTPIPLGVGTAVGQTQTAAMWTATITPTSTNVPDELRIVNWLNEEPVKDPYLFSTRLDQLEETIGASYKFLNVEFIVENGVTTIFEVDVRCECAIETQCCTAERMFVVTMNEMYLHSREIIAQVPLTVNRMRVVTFDHTRPLGAISVDWVEIRKFMDGTTNGLQFGFNVRRE